MAENQRNLLEKYIQNVYGAFGAMIGGGAVSRGLNQGPWEGLEVWIIGLVILAALTFIIEQAKGIIPVIRQKLMDIIPWLG